ncbi:MAG: YidC/Oxa1 family membrane protein insertase, partial [Solirubrobacteraceae bacterium]
MTVVFANIFQPLIDVFEAVLKFFHDNVGLTWGMSIIAMTVVVRAAILPLTLRQMKSMRRMQELSPKIKELQAKYKGDKQRQNEEMMKFYRENQVNPLGSCLPLLLQLPVFISLFYMLRTDLKHDMCPGIGVYAKEIHKDLGSISCSSYGHATHQTF